MLVFELAERCHLAVPPLHIATPPLATAEKATGDVDVVAEWLVLAIIDIDAEADVCPVKGVVLVRVSDDGDTLGVLVVDVAVEEPSNGRLIGWSGEGTMNDEIVINRERAIRVAGFRLRRTERLRLRLIRAVSDRPITPRRCRGGGGRDGVEEGSKVNDAGHCGGMDGGQRGKKRQR